ncbi:RusA family crossover junction endodeoxyribonuclease [Pseudomonas sp.]|uniref:RusA family crossover junction endodeoxyribonuclease n=1 Tax=Pseudomonas sp. TaxID=306 RepID=UPI0025825EBE|nr:RusA family crossover junction endodeoxyribonuclease [Pseudomonas sp.]
MTLPWPPTVNTYYRHVVIGRAPRTLISEAGRRYREAVKAQVAGQVENALQGDLEVFVEAWFPDRRRRDLDNLLKSLLDSLTHAGVWQDDSQIIDLRIRKAPLVGGMVKVEIKEVT